jgi:VCBS repeat-containing protein
VALLNYAGKFDSIASDSDSSAHFKIDSLSHVGHGDGNTVTIPDAHLLFSGDYERSGSDLIVSDQLHRVVVPNYFQGDKRPMLVSLDGAPLDPTVIQALTGHVTYAQAGGAAAVVAKVVGHVVKMTGSASVVRNGVIIDLNNGDNVYQNDVVQTGSGSTLGLVMIDGTTFNLSAGARLMLNDLTYDANSTSNTSLFTLVQGAASFVAGQVAKSGDMKVGTPVATMGIRGTAVILDISSVDGQVSISVVDQRDGQVHAVQVFNTRGVLIGTVTSSGSGLTLTPTATFEVIAQESNKTVAQVAQEFNAFQTLLQTYDAAKALFPDLPQHTDANPQSPPGGGSGTAPGQANPGDTSPIKDVIPVDQPKVVPIPINLPAPTDADPKAFKTVTVTITVIKTIDVTPAIDKPNFNIPDQVKVSPDPSDTVAYVPGTAKIISAVGPAYTPAGLDLAHFINLDPATGHVTYDVQNFAFLKAGDKVVVTIGFDSSVGPVTFHETLPLTIGGVNDPPVIDHAALAVSQGGTVVLSAANIGVADPDNTSFTFTIANVTHGTFQTTLGGVSWVDVASFTSTDLAAGHVRFVHDGSVTAPTFSIQANDGEAAHNLSNVLDGAVTFANVNSAPVVTATSDAFTERAGTGSATPDTASGTISFTDVDLTDRPVVTTSFASATYSDAQHNDITLSLTAAQLAHVLAVEAPLTVTPSAGNTNNGSATWNYSVPDNKFDFLAAGEALTLTYTAQVDDGHGGVVTTPLTVTITGTNDAPVPAAGSVASAAIDVPVANTGTNTLSPAVAAQLNAPGLISGLPGESGFGTLALPADDDNSSGAINFTSVFGSAGLDFFGTSYTSLFVNNNGNITFGAANDTFTPSPIGIGFNFPIIAPFWADVDTRGHGAVYYDLDTADGVMTITWDNVGYYPSGTNKLDSFQLVLINEGNGNFDIEYRYGNIQWTTGSASGGSNGLGGTPARAGYSAGDGVHSFELPQSGNQAALLALPTTAGNTGIAGVDEFNVRNGQVGPSTLTSTGTINFSDPDLSDSHAIQSVTYTGGGNELGTLSLTKAADTTGTGTGGQFVWTYTAASETVRNALNSISTHAKVETFDVVISDGHGGTTTQTVSVTLNGTGAPSSNAAPVIATDHFTVTQNLDGTTTVAGLSVSDANALPTETFTTSAVTAGAGSSITPSTNSGHLTDINAALATGVVYHPGPTPPQTDKVTLTAADSLGATDTVNFIFNEAGTGPTTTLVGTAGKDVIFATGHQDILTGGGGQDQFVFKPSSGTTDVQHTITDFVAGLDKIDVRQFSNISSLADAPETQQGNDTLITLDSHETLLLKNVIATNLHVSDFIIRA